MTMRKKNKDGMKGKTNKCRGCKSEYLSLISANHDGTVVSKSSSGFRWYLYFFFFVFLICQVWETPRNDFAYCVFPFSYFFPRSNRWGCYYQFDAADAAWAPVSGFYH